MKNTLQQLIARGYWTTASSYRGNVMGASPDGEGEGGGEGQGEGDVGQDGDEYNHDDAGGDVEKDPPQENKPSDKEAELLKEVMKRKKQNADLEAQIGTLRTQLAQFDGIDIEQVKTLLAEKKAAEEKRLEEKGNWDALKKQMKEENDKIVQRHVDENATLKATIASQRELIDKLTLGNAFGMSEFIAKEMPSYSPEKAKKVFGDHFEIEDGRVVAYDKPRGAKDRAQLVDASGDPLDFEAALRKIVDADPDRDRILRPKGKPGAGSSTLNVKPQIEKPVLTGVSRIEAGLNNLAKK